MNEINSMQDFLYQQLSDDKKVTIVFSNGKEIEANHFINRIGDNGVTVQNIVSSEYVKSVTTYCINTNQISYIYQS
ncbi:MULTISPECIES: hypothetical protein [Convivina]|uniref:hypothetical protein n=1 Tax=Convivina TaxID=1697027 RepID=UPI0020107438|nr:MULTISPECIES: hypothetical protein [Convivina]CAH1855689.1 hypothetical protein R077811_01095 [Convivina intestini]CAH1855764.1 hypothetical protein R078138_01206 [Convivina sp. LMG 32447]